MAGGEEEGRGRGESVCVNGHFEPLVRERIVSMGRVAIDKENLSLISDRQMGCLGGCSHTSFKVDPCILAGHLSPFLWFDQVVYAKEINDWTQVYHILFGLTVTK